MNVKNSLLALASSVSLMTAINTVQADGTETLGPPSIAIAPGSDIVVAGTGLLSQPGMIDFNVPVGASVEQVILYWEEQHVFNGEDDTIEINGMEVVGTKIGGGDDVFFTSSGANIYSTTYRADISGLGLVSPGLNSLSVDGLENVHASNGAGILVIYDDGSAGTIEIFDGNDLAFLPKAPTLDTTVPQTFNFAASASPRNGEISMFVSSVRGAASQGGDFRPSAVVITIGGNPPITMTNLFNSNDGDEWDTLVIPVIIPAGVSQLTVQPISYDDLSGRLPASFAWNAAALSISLGGEGCTPGYWRQSHHFDSWTKYNPNDLFGSVFDDAFTGMTLSQVVALGGGDLNALGRHAVAALLNAASADVDYDLTEQGVIDQFNAVYPGSKDDYNALKDLFEGFNEQGCPLN